MSTLAQQTTNGNGAFRCEPDPGRELQEAQRYLQLAARRIEPYARDVTLLLSGEWERGHVLREDEGWIDVLVRDRHDWKHHVAKRRDNSPIDLSDVEWQSFRPADGKGE